jgi:hypothetical protein
MNAEGYEAACREFKRMREAYLNLAVAPNYEAAIGYWTDFIIRLQRVYNKLTAATKNDNRSRPWMGLKQRERSDDELLQYLQQARHADEHAYEEIAAEEISAYLIPPEEGGAHVNSVGVLTDGTIVIDAEGMNGEEVDVRELIALNRFRLVPVTNSGRTYPAPTQHKGLDVDPNNVVVLCRYALKHVEQLLNEARQFVR